ncbi:MAG: thiamine-phosphate kinase [Geobacter sp.]|nr:MAG: thiamine-phosphate kinase [Geobacter sp.]
MKLGELGEFGLISRIAANVSMGHGVITGIGDDAAVTAVTPGMQLLTSTDMLLEGVHFRRSWHAPYLLGRKSLAVNISDIAAMGGIPRWATLSLAIPKDCSLEYLDSFTKGFLSLAADHGVALIGGDTCRSNSGLIISVTIQGEQLPEMVVRRSGAQPGDEIWVTGTQGDAAFGLALLEGKIAPFRQGRGGETDDAERYLISRLLDPTPRIATGRALAESGLVTAMIDISDGLMADFEHIAELSGVGGTIQADTLPISPALQSASQHLSDFPYSLVLSGGEDYELAFTAPVDHRKKIIEITKKSGIDATPVGIVTSSPGVKAVRSDGSQIAPQAHGFTHFT